MVVHVCVSLWLASEEQLCDRAVWEHIVFPYSSSADACNTVHPVSMHVYTHTVSLKKHEWAYCSFLLFINTIGLSIKHPSLKSILLYLFFCRSLDGPCNLISVTNWHKMWKTVNNISRYRVTSQFYIEILFVEPQIKILFSLTLFDQKVLQWKVSTIVDCVAFISKLLFMFLNLWACWWINNPDGI